MARCSDKERSKSLAFKFSVPSGKVVSKIMGHNCKVVLIALSWSKMPLFCNLVMFSSQIPLCLPLRETIHATVQRESAQGSQT